MNAVVAPASGRAVISTTLHHLDLATQRSSSVAIASNNADLAAYLDELLLEIAAKPQHRAYRLASATTEFATCLKGFHQAVTLLASHANALADRLLRIEIATDTKYSHLKTAGTLIRKGSFLQYLYTEGGATYYLGVKIDHHAYIDETDLKRHIGLGQTQKLFKACRVEIDAAGLPRQVLVFDTNAKPSVYWWREFWELAELRSDRHNTEHAIRGVMKVLNKFKKSAPLDHTHLRNAAITAFRQVGQLDFPAFVDSMFANYQPAEPKLGSMLPKLIDELRQLPVKQNFDPHFGLDASAVPFKRRNVELSEQISLSYDESLPNLDENIWSSKTPDGKCVIVVRADEGTERFKFKEWE